MNPITKITIINSDAVQLTFTDTTVLTLRVGDSITVNTPEVVVDTPVNVAPDATPVV